MSNGALTLKRLLAAALLALAAMASCVLLEQGDGELDRYHYEEVR